MHKQLHQHFLHQEEAAAVAQHHHHHHHQQHYQHQQLLYKDSNDVVDEAPPSPPGHDAVADDDGDDEVVVAATSPRSPPPAAVVVKVKEEAKAVPAAEAGAGSSSCEAPIEDLYDDAEAPQELQAAPEGEEDDEQVGWCGGVMWGEVKCSVNCIFSRVVDITILMTIHFFIKYLRSFNYDRNKGQQKKDHTHN